MGSTWKSRSPHHYEERSRHRSDYRGARRPVQSPRLTDGPIEDIDDGASEDEGCPEKSIAVTPASDGMRKDDRREGRHAGQYEDPVESDPLTNGHHAAPPMPTPGPLTGFAWSASLSHEIPVTRRVRRDPAGLARPQQMVVRAVTWHQVRLDPLRRYPEDVGVSLRPWTSRRRSAGVLGGVLFLAVTAAVLVLLASLAAVGLLLMVFIGVVMTGERLLGLLVPPYRCRRRERYLTMPTVPVRTVRFGAEPSQVIEARSEELSRRGD